MQFLYLLISIYLGRKNPLFFLIFPLALLQGPGAFIDTRTVLVAPEYFLLGKNIFKDITIFYLLGVVIYLYKRVKSKLIWETPMKWYFLLVVFLSIITLTSYGTSYEAIAVIRLFLYMALGYYLILLILSATNYVNFTNFFSILLISNIIQSFLYVLNSCKVLPIFDQTMAYQEIESGMGEFYRDFQTIPIFSNLFFVFSFAAIILNNTSINKKILYATLVAYPLVLLYTFTRSLLIVSALELALVIGVMTIFNPSKILKPKLLAIIIGSLLFFSIAQMVFVSEVEYFTERLEGVSKEGKNERNVDIRLQYHQKAWELLSQEHALLTGYAFNKELEPKMDAIGAWRADSTLPFLLIYTGIIGIIIYYINLIYFIYMCIRNRFYKLNALAITLFTLLFSSFISSFIMGGYPWGSPIIFINYAFIAYINYKFKNRIRLAFLKKNISKV